MSVKIEQHWAQFTVILFCAVASVIGLIVSVMLQDTLAIGGALVSVLAYGGFAVAAYFRQRWAYLSTVVVATLLTSAILVIDGGVRAQFLPVFFIPPVMALILAGPTAVALSGITALVMPALLIPGENNPYTHPITLIICVLAIAGMTVGRMVLDTLVERSHKAEQAARAAEADAQREAALAQARADELEVTTNEQRRLIEVIGTLELPTVPLAENILLLPMVGHLDTRRMQLISAHLLNQIATQRIKVVILDLAGVPLIDSEVARHIQQLIDAVNLMGAEVCVTGIRADVARTMTDLGIQMNATSIARTPQEVLASLYDVNRSN
jgi:anti-anti-sigma regulatory factor